MNKNDRSIKLIKGIGVVFILVIFEVMILQIAYITFNGRGYCYYCLAGTFLGGISKIGGQQIDTDLNKCINCKLCDREC